MFELPQTEQEVFDKVATHLLTQNQRCVKENNTYCRYKLNGMSCAAGCLIPDEFYNEEVMEHKSWENLCQEELVPEEYKTLICDLQSIHDDCEVEDWCDLLIDLARQYGLSAEKIFK